MKRIIAFALTFAISLTFSCSCFADEDESRFEEAFDDMDDFAYASVFEDSDEIIDKERWIGEDGSVTEREVTVICLEDGTIRKAESGRLTFADGTVGTEFVTFLENTPGYGRGRGFVEDTIGNRIAEVSVLLSVVDDGPVIRRVTVYQYADGREEQKTETLYRDDTVNENDTPVEESADEFEDWEWEDFSDGDELFDE